MLPKRIFKGEYAMIKKRFTLFVFFTLLMVISANLSAGGGKETTELNPGETVLISGVEWGPPSNFNPLDTSGHVAGKYQIKLYKRKIYFEKYKERRKSHN